jgi:hypothetical protein
MLIMVIENPKQFTIVSAVPFDSATVFCAINVENKGESAMTTIPQNMRKKIKNPRESIKKSKGEKRQHVPDRHNA